MKSALLILAACVAFCVLPSNEASAFGFGRVRQRVVVQRVVVRQQFVAPVVVHQPFVTQAIVAPVVTHGFVAPVVQQQVIVPGCQAFFVR